MGHRRIYSESVREASLALGGVPCLASRLNVPIDTINRWVAGDENPPLDAFLECLEIIAEGPWRIRPATEAG